MVNADVLSANKSAVPDVGTCVSRLLVGVIPAGTVGAEVEVV